jgi:hypothetical protein
MKNLFSFLSAAAIAAVLAVNVHAAADKKYTADSCCDKAKKAGKECAHKCCIEAEKKGEVCKKCNKE